MSHSLPRLRAIVPAVVTTLAVGVGGTACALAGAGPATSAPPSAETHARSSVGGLLAGSYDADFGRLSVSGQDHIRCPKPPSVPGAAKVGDVLRVGPIVWKPAAVSVSYQWYAGRTPIRGADSTAYRPDVSDLGKKITVVAVATKKGYRPETVVTPVGEVKPGDLDATSKPAVAGPARVGSTLSVAGAGWSEKGVKVDYVWYAGRKVLGEGKRLTLTRALQGAKVRVVATASKRGFRDAVVTTAWTDRVR